jgi:hypothetical protein
MGALVEFLIFTPLKISLTTPLSSVVTKICPSSREPLKLYVPAEVTVTLLPSTLTPFPSAVIEFPLKVTGTTEALSQTVSWASSCVVLFSASASVADEALAAAMAVLVAAASVVWVVEVWAAAAVELCVVEIWLAAAEFATAAVFSGTVEQAAMEITSNKDIHKVIHFFIFIS